MFLQDGVYGKDVLKRGEIHLMQKDTFREMINQEYDKAQTIFGKKAIDKVERIIFPLLPSNDIESVELFDFLVSTGESRYLWLVTKWIKRRKMYQLQFMQYYEGWLYGHIHRWGMCDVFCYRVLNPMLESYPSLFERVMVWADSSKTYVRRAAPVCLIQSNRSFRINVSIEKVLMVAEKLKHDEEIHVQKGVGWLLKYAYLKYENGIYNYLKENVENLPRVIFRYALEKAPKKVKDELMGL